MSVITGAFSFVYNNDRGVDLLLTVPRPIFQSVQQILQPDAYLCSTKYFVAALYKPANIFLW
jgi:hypothetical protein